MNEKQRKSAESVVDCLLQLQELTGSEGNYAYRGQKNADWKVESGASRRIKEINPSEEAPSKENFINYHEKELLEPARMDGYGDGEVRPLYDLELLAKLQHHDAATCLIDFTRNFFVAIWFACQSHKEEAEEEKEAKETDGKIFILDTSDEKNFLSLEEEDLKKEVRAILKFQTRDEAISSKETIIRSILKPSWWHWSPQGLIQRILKQDSLFIFGQTKIEKTLLQEIEIKHEHKDKIIEELDRLGITERTLFKDLPGFAESHSQNKSLPLGYGKAKYYLRKGNEALQRGDSKGAMADYNEAIKLNSDYVEAYFNRGRAKSNLGDFNGAIADYDQAIELDSNNVEAYNNRGSFKSFLGDKSGAIADYDRVIEIKPDDAVAYFNRGNSKSDLEAIADYNRAIELKPDFVEAYLNRGTVKSILGKHRSAVADYSEAINLKYDYAKAYHNRGNANRRLGNNSVAIADYDRAIELELDFAGAYYNRGQAYDSLGDKERDKKMARQDYLKARELAKQNNDERLVRLCNEALSKLDNENNNRL